MSHNVVLPFVEFKICYFNGYCLNQTFLNTRGEIMNFQMKIWINVDIPTSISWYVAIHFFKFIISMI